MVNLGVPHHIIQRYLGHSGPEMTSRYAHIHDATMRDKLADYLKSSLVDVTGKTVAQEGANDSSDLQWFTRNIMAQALTNGDCAIPDSCRPLPASERLLELRPLPNRRHLPGSASHGAAGHRRNPRQGRSKRLDAATGDEPAQADEPGQHRDGSGGSSWLGTQKASSKAARTRSEASTERALVAIRKLQAEEIEINFRSMAAHAKVSTAWLYGNQALRERILKLRQRPQKNSRETAPARRQLSNERIVAALRLRIRSLEELNRELQATLEIVYGRLACQPPKVRRLHDNDVPNRINKEESLDNYR